MSYHDGTNQILRTSGAPRCPKCKEEMSPVDDHSRFGCICDGSLFSGGFDFMAGGISCIPPDRQSNDSSTNDDESKK